ncbi:MAG: hypothetical protein M1837_004508 [Sclerophora amabilis]|nr:MAG: hypothetical protein M1837_004508 [Sclerophora amabilis]
MASHAAIGAAALARGDYEQAITSYDTAISAISTSPDYYIKRSTAYQRRTPPNLSLALLDAEMAVTLAHKRAKREAIATAQMRRGIALYALKRFADAGQCFKWVQQRNEKEQGLGMWQKKVEVELGKLGDGDEGKDTTIVEIPDVEAPAASGSRETSGETQERQAEAAKAPVKPVEGVQTPASKIRHEWYQTAENVVLTLLVKGAPKDKTTVDIHEGSVAISFPMPNSSTYDFSLDPLFAPIDSTTSTSSILSTKIELILKKSTPGQKWPALEGTGPASIETGKDGKDNQATSSEAVRRAAIGSSTANAPASSYPTSSRSGPKNWDKVAKDLTKKPKKRAKEEGEDAKEADDDDDEGEKEEDGGDDFEDEADPVNGFFKKLYAGADPDTRRAMMKSYQESNGTSLSTNWEEVGKGKVETSPPDGMVAKKWES